MKKNYFLVSLLAVMTFGVFTASAQVAPEKPKHRDWLLQSVAVGVKAGTYGFGGEVSTTLIPHVKLRAGYTMLKYTYTDELTYDAPAVGGGDDIAVSFSKAELNFPNASLMLDLYPGRQGSFCFTGGLFFGQNKIKVAGNASDEFVIEDVAITPGPDGYFDADLLLGGTVKPYLGIGIGRSVPKRRVGFKMELGAVIQGRPTVESSYADMSWANQEISELSVDGVPDFAWKLWPMVSLGINVRIY